jgi:hypothetical protein
MPKRWEHHRSGGYKKHNMTSIEDTALDIIAREGGVDRASITLESTLRDLDTIPWHPRAWVVSSPSRCMDTRCVRRVLWNWWPSWAHWPRASCPRQINLQGPDPACDLDVVPNVARQRPVRAALSHSLAFGGLNAVLALRRAN